MVSKNWGKQKDEVELTEVKDKKKLPPKYEHKVLKKKTQTKLKEVKK